MRFILFIFLEVTTLLKAVRDHLFQIEDDRVIIIDNVGIACFANRTFKSIRLAERFFCETRNKSRKNRIIKTMLNMNKIYLKYCTYTYF